MCTFGLLGQLVGWIIFEYLNDQILTGFIGIISIVTALNYGLKRFVPWGLTSQELSIFVSKKIYQRSFFWCGLSGITSFISLSGGIPVQIFLLPHSLKRQIFVGTLSVYFLVINIAKIPFYNQIGMFSKNSAMISSYLLLIIPIGIFIGKWLNAKVNDKIFYDISHLALLAMGLKLLFEAF